MPSPYSKRIEYYKRRYQELKDKIRKSITPDKKQAKKAYDKNRYQKNKELMCQQSKAWAAKNVEIVRNTKKEWYFRNKKAVFATMAKRRACKLNATPKWLTSAHLKEIRKFYSNRPDGYHVDHIIPLRGKNVCGLHVIWNLQYLPALENFKKGAKLCPTP